MTTVNPASTKKPEPAKKPDFEYSLARLEEIVGKLENANLSLDAAWRSFFEEGEALRDCQKYLGQAEGKVEILAQEGRGWRNGPGNLSIPPRKIPKPPGLLAPPSRPPTDEPSCIFR